MYQVKIHVKQREYDFSSLDSVKRFLNIYPLIEDLGYSIYRTQWKDGKVVSQRLLDEKKPGV